MSEMLPDGTDEAPASISASPPCRPSKRPRRAEKDKPPVAGDDSRGTGRHLLDLPRDLLVRVLGFVGVGSFRYVSCCRALRSAQLEKFPGPDGRKTHGKSIAASTETVKIWEEDPRGRNRLHLVDHVIGWVAWHGNLEMGKRLQEKYKDDLRLVGVDMNSCCVRKAAEAGHVSVCKSIRESVGESHWAHRGVCSYLVSCAFVACKHKQWRVFKWAIQDFATNEEVKADLENFVLHNLGEYGESEILNWCVDRSFDMTKVAFRAAKNGQIDVLNTLHGRCAIGAESNLCKMRLASTAIGSGQVCVLDWLDQNGYLKELRGIGGAEGEIHNRQLIDQAICQGVVPVMEWLFGNGFEVELDKRMCSRAAGCGHLTMLKWLRARGCPWDSEALEYARNANQTEVSRWILQNSSIVE